MVEDISKLKTEKRNERTSDLDLMSTYQILEVMNDEDNKVIKTIKDALPQIEKVVDATVGQLKKAGRLILLGAGTSGRLAILDAAECVPTFGTHSVVGLIAGGEKAFIKAVENAEDSKELAISDLKEINLNENDMVIAISASGRTPYAIGALEYANLIGAVTAGISCNYDALLSHYANYSIEVNAGSEVLTGSTRLKSGTCQKLILNMITTTSMIKMGKVYKNLMVDMIATNEKLEIRSVNIIKEATGVDTNVAKDYLKKACGNIKTAIVMILANVSKDEANERLTNCDGFVRDAIKWG